MSTLFRRFTGRLLAAAILAIATSASIRADIYRWVDENGIEHFSDRAPDTDQPVTHTFVESDPEPRISLRRMGPKERPIYYVHNMFRGPVQVELKFVSSRNAASDPPLPARFVLPGNSEVKVLTVMEAEPGAGYSFKLGLTHVPGAPLPMPDHNLILHPPFPAGQTFHVSQGLEGKHTHNDSQSEFAIDIVMPIGTPVLAAASGVVMDIEEDFRKGGTSRKQFATRANHVRLLHDDGTMSNYAHLDYNGVNVRLGQRVVAGQMLGRSGNTGFSSGPHLHFSVQRNLGMSLQGIPFEFRAAGGKLVLPISGERITGTLARR